jgi:signal transduction histidine kinase
LALLLMTRLLGAAVAVALLGAHHVTDHDASLVAVTVAWTALTLVAFGRVNALRASVLAWLADTAAALGLVVLSGDWRSAFYVYALTTLVLPTTRLPARAAVVWGASFSLAYGVTAMLTRQLPVNTIGNTIRLETLATHLFVPVIIALALGYAGELLNRLQQERSRSERLAVQTERQRIAWELHDSAKQRVHAAHLLLSALDGRLTGTDRDVISGALVELRGATADMETSIAELRTPVDGRPVDELLRERAGELALAADAQLIVVGSLPVLPPLVAAHTYRIAAEALTNAVRHGRSRAVRVEMAGDDGLDVVVVDDGVGLPDEPRHHGHGLRSMRARAETIGGELEVTAGPGGRGTRVHLRLRDIPTTDGAS